MNIKAAVKIDDQLDDSFSLALDPRRFREYISPSRNAYHGGDDHDILKVP